MNKVKLLIIIILISNGFIYTGAWLNQIKAATSCTANVTPHSVTTFAQTNFVFEVQNTGDTMIRWMRLTKPSDNFEVDSPLILDGFNITPGNSTTFNRFAATGSSEASSANWTLEVSDDANGASPIACTGDLGVAITGQGVDTFAPVVTSLTIVDAAATSATIVWTTNENTTGTIDYGTSESYGTQFVSSTLSTSHSLSLTNLSANTTYHFNLKSYDSVGNLMNLGDNTFYTSVTIAPIQITTVITPTPTPTPVPDTTPPVIAITTKLEKSYASSPQIQGRATDNTGLSSIEYSYDGGKSWLKVDSFSEGSSPVNFTFKAPITEDGNYEMKVRATDMNSNTKTLEAFTLIIDRLAPQAGGLLLSLGPHIFTPNANGVITIPSELSAQFTISAVGGPTDIVVSLEDEQFELTKNTETGLWSKILSFSNEGEIIPGIHLKDDAENNTERKLNPIHVVENGKVLSNQKPLPDARITVFVLESGLFSLWESKQYGQANPQTTNEEGKYALLLPPGTYYIEIRAAGMHTAVTDMFTIDAPTPIITDFNLREARFLQSVFHDTVPIELSTIESEDRKNALINQELPYYEFNDFTTFELRGKPTIVTVLATWFPQTSAQLTVLEELAKDETINVAVIMPQNSFTTVDIFTKRGKYQVPIIADPDGVLIEPLEVSTYPTHYFINRKGTIGNIKTGILSIEELRDNLVI